MPEEYGAPGAQMGTGQGAESAPVDGDDKGFDFERGYHELRPEYTRATQELSTTRDRLSAFEELFDELHDSDPEVQRAAMEALGLEPAVDTGPSSGAEPEYVDPLEAEVEALQAWRDEVDQQRELETAYAEDAELQNLQDDFIGGEIDMIEQFTGVAIPESEEEILGNLAIVMSDDEGLPDVRGAYQRLYGPDGFLESQRERWIETKAGAFSAPLGTSIPADQKPMTPRERVAYIDERWRVQQDQQ